MKIPELFYSNIIDIFIDHKCIINENKQGSTAGVTIILDYISDDVYNCLDKYINLIETTEHDNNLIRNAKLKFNKNTTPIQNTMPPNENIFNTKHTFHMNSLSANEQHIHVYQKIKQLKIRLFNHTNNTPIYMPSPTCFWCDGDIASEYLGKFCIPISVHVNVNNDDPTDNEPSVCGYGSFCRPECAAGFLKSESGLIDQSTLLERYMLLNQIYKPVQIPKGYTGITPAVSPHYITNVFSGELSHNEYIEATSGKVCYRTLQKPYTHILPELHETYNIIKM